MTSIEMPGYHHLSRCDKGPAHFRWRARAAVARTEGGPAVAVLWRGKGVHGVRFANVDGDLVVLGASFEGVGGFLAFASG